MNKELVSYYKRSYKKSLDKLECILDQLKENKSHIMLVDWEQEILLDCITNLQQEKEDYKSRCEKASEFIKEKARNNCWIDQYEASDLINILQNGSDSQ